MQNKQHAGSTTIEGSELEQAEQLFALWQQFKEGAVRKYKVAPEDVELVIEDFILMPGAHAGGTDGIRPARVAWAFEGFRQGRAAKFKSPKHTSEAIWQPAQAMRNRRHLKKWDCWVRGREHERSAFCHIGERLRRTLV